MVSGDSGSSRVGRWRERVERNIWRKELLGMSETRRYAAAGGRRDGRRQHLCHFLSFLWLRIA